MVVDRIGKDEDGKPIDILFGAPAMGNWSIRPIPNEERLGLWHYPEEFVEFQQGSLTDGKTKAVHEVKLTAGKPVVIEMRSKQFDTYLRLEDAKGKTLAENDDIDAAAKNLNSRILFMPKADGVFRIVATSFQQKGRGAYEIVIREYGPAKPR